MNNFELRDMSEVIKINKLELASELAEIRLVNGWSDSIVIYNDDPNGDTYYTEEAQNVFNRLYDEFLELIEKCKIEK